MCLSKLYMANKDSCWKTGKKYPILYFIAILALLMTTATFNIQFWFCLKTEQEYQRANILGLTKTTIKFSIFEQYFDEFLNTLNAKKIVQKNIVDSLKKICWKSVDAFKKQQNKIFRGFLVFQYALC